MEGNRPGPSETVQVFRLVFIVLGLIAAIAVLASGLSRGNPVAYVVVGGLAFGLVFAVGGGAVLAVQGIGERREARRARQEQARFRDNTMQDLALMQQVANTQAALTGASVKQHRLLADENRALRQALPGSNGAIVDIDALAFDDAVFDDLED